MFLLLLCLIAHSDLLLYFQTHNYPFEQSKLIDSGVISHKQPAFVRLCLCVCVCVSVSVCVCVS